MQKKIAREGKKKTETDEIAEIMAANMAANMANPDFLNNHDRIMEEAAKKVIAERDEKRKEKPDQQE